MTRITWLFGIVGLIGGLLVALPQSSQADEPATVVAPVEYHYFVHAGNCSRSMHLRGSYSCHDEAAFAVEELKDQGFTILRISSSPKSYNSSI